MTDVQPQALLEAHDERQGESRHTLASLERHAAKVIFALEDQPSEWLFEQFELDTEVQGAFVVDEHGEPVGLLTASKVREMAFKPFAKDLFRYRPIRFMSAFYAENDAEHPIDAGILTTCEQALCRGEHRRFEPIIVRRRDGSRFLLSMQTLLSAQGRMLSHALDSLERQRATAARAAVHDPLTGLLNRGGVVRALDRLCRSRSIDRGLVVLFIDLDRFKVINDSLGHDAGDALLCATAKRLSSLCVEWCARRPRSERAFAGRLGGDEFVIVASGSINVEDAEQLAGSVCARVREPIEVSKQAVFSTASVGVALAVGAESTPSELMRDADIAMYRSKTRGKDRFSLFDQSLRDEFIEQHQLETDLRRALENDALVLHYQPIVSLESGRTVSAESLIRWPQRDGSFITPLRFVPLAEETGLISDLTRWVARRAASDLAALRREGVVDDGFRLSINISRGELHDPTLCARLIESITSSGLSPRNFLLEITETAVGESPEKAALVLGDLRAHGFTIALDDFGVGQSSLTSLRTLPIDTLKIDRGFVRELDRDRCLSAIVHAVCGLAENLGMKVAVEGIETQTQLAQLQAMACDYAQGYLFSKPIPLDELRAWLRNGASETEPLRTAA